MSDRPLCEQGLRVFQQQLAFDQVGKHLHGLSFAQLTQTQGIGAEGLLKGVEVVHRYGATRRLRQSVVVHEALPFMV
jgi:hypothetical protein